MKLNIGCGSNVFPGWVNLDREDMTGYLTAVAGCDDGALATWPEHQQVLAAQLRAGLITCEIWDLRKGFAQYKDSSVDAIYLGQIIEHLNPIYEAPSLMSHCMRMLKPGAPIRITTPDLGLILEHYLTGKMGDFAKEQPEFYTGCVPSMQFSMLLFGSGGPKCTWDHYEGHMVAYDGASMHALLTIAGFVDISFDRKSAEFDDCIDQGMSHSLGAEGRRPAQ